MPLQFNRFTKIATLPIVDGRTITVQDLYNQFIDFQDEPGNMDLNQMITAGGKDDISGDGSQLTVITATLLDGWRLAFEAGAGPGQEVGTVTGGNLVALLPNGDSQFPIAQTAFVSGFIAQATTGALIEGSDAPTAQEIWDYTGPFAVGGIGAYIKSKLLTTAKALQIFLK